MEIDNLHIYGFETGDLIFYNETVKKCFPLKTENKFDCTLLIKNPICMKKKGIYIIYINKEILPDILSLKIILLKEFLKYFRGVVYYKKLRLNIEKSDKFDEIVELCYDYMKNIPYNLSPLDWIKADINLRKSVKNINNIDWSALLTMYIYSKLGLILLKNINIKTDDIIKNRITLIQCTLGKLNFLF